MNKSLEQVLHMKYVTEMKDKCIICKELGISESSLDAWISHFNLSAFRIAKSNYFKYNNIISEKNRSIGVWSKNTKKRIFRS